MDENQIWAALRTCYDPEIPINIVDLGLVYQCNTTRVDDRLHVEIEMTLTAPGCPVADQILADVEHALLAIPEVERAEVRLVFEPPWDPSRMSEAARLEAGLY